MKNLLLTFICALPFLAVAQTEGTITYEETMKMEIELPDHPGIDKEQLAKMLPGEQKSEKVLYYTSNESLFTDMPKSEEDNKAGTFEHEDEGMQIKIVVANDNHQVYRNLAKGKLIEQQDFMGKTFLISGESQKDKWKLTGENRTIGEFACQKATMTQDDRTIEAWFTSAIPIAAGPADYGDLPGLIIELTSTSKNGSRSFVITNIDFTPLEKGTIKAPKKGKAVTQAQYEEIVEAKMKEMEEAMGGSRDGGDNVRIRVRG